VEYYNPEMPLFTVLLEVDGGTYIAQLRSASVRGAITKYAAEVVKGIEVGTLSFRKRLSNELRDEAPVAIHGVRNVWCCSASIKNKFVLLNLIETSGH